jgi:hypothetical protein
MAFPSFDQLYGSRFEPVQDVEIGRAPSGAPDTQTAIDADQGAFVVEYFLDQAQLSELLVNFDQNRTGTQSFTWQEDGTAHVVFWEQPPQWRLEAGTGKYRVSCRLAKFVTEDAPESPDPAESPTPIDSPGFDSPGFDSPGDSPGFLPTDLPNLASWVAADESDMWDDELQTDPIKNNDLIFWIDESLASGTIPEQWQVTNRAIYRSNAGGTGFAGIEFDPPGSGVIAQANDSGGTCTVHTQDEVTIFVVYRHNVTSNYAWMFSTFADFGAVNGNGGYTLLHGGESTAYLGGAVDGAGNQTYTQASTPVPTNTITLQTLRTSGAGGTLESYLDGTLADSFAQPAGTFYKSANIATIGRINSVGAALDSGSYLFEWLVYDRRLNDTELADVHDYLKSKYGIT